MCNNLCTSRQWQRNCYFPIIWSYERWTNLRGIRGVPVPPLLGLKVYRSPHISGRKDEEFAVTCCQQRRSAEINLHDALADPKVGWEGLVLNSYSHFRPKLRPCFRIQLYKPIFSKVLDVPIFPSAAHDKQ